MLEEEIDLRPYIRAVLQKWMILVVAGVFGLIIGAIASSLREPVYTASAFVNVNQTQDIIAVDIGIQESQEEQPLKALPELALSDAVLSETLQALELSDEMKIGQLRTRLNTVLSPHNSIIRLEATSADAEQATQIVNSWANVYVNWANRSLGRQPEQRAQFYEAQRQEAELVLAEAQAQLTQFELSNSATIISNTLEAHNQVYFDYVHQSLHTQQIINDINAFKQQLENRPASIGLTFSDQMIYTKLQLSSFGEQEGNGLPITFQIETPEALNTDDLDEQLILLDDLTETLELKRTQIDQALMDLEPSILNLQEQYQAVVSEKTRLQSNIEIAKQTLSAIAFEIAEDQLAFKLGNEDFQVISLALTPQANTGLRSIYLIIIAGFTGVLAGMFYIIVQQWWGDA